MADLEFPHLFINREPNSRQYRNPTGGGSEFQLPNRPNRVQHADRISGALDKVWAESSTQMQQRKAVALPARTGTYVEFESAPDFELKFASLEARASGLRLLNVRTAQLPDGRQVQRATIFVPHGKEKILANKVQKYRDENTPKNKPKNKDLVESVESLRLALLHSFWNDDVGLIPTADASVSCEVWLRTPSVDGDAVLIDAFREACATLEIPVREGHISFPERAVVLVEANSEQLTELIASVDNLAEFRRAKETADFWIGMENAGQAEWAQNLAGRLTVEAGTNVSACVVDTGVNNGHTLLAPILSDANCHTVDIEWGTSDIDGHGTSMCGNVAFGENLGHWLQTETAIALPFKLESVKLIPKSGYKEDQDLNGYRTDQAIARAEIENPDDTRAICMAITSTDGRDLGRPSSWSGAIDALAAGVDDEESRRRLFVLSAGNVTDSSDWANYPVSNETSDIHDPGQAWNALTVGAVTFKDHIADEGLANTYVPIANAGQLSPYSTTSMMWESKWPNKPDIVLEGGNAAVDGTNFTTQLDDLSLLSLNNQPQLSTFTGNYATSAAAALATEQAARLHAQYPNAWPETIRALMVHSARWTSQLWEQFSDPNNSVKANRERLLRACGYGVPSIQRAMSSATNSLTMIVQGEIQPFREKAKNDYKANDMHFYALPWPKQALNDLPLETMVTIDVTLSYFIEPGPGEIGWRDKYRYRSHGLDFNIKKPTESLDEFVTRLNKAARDDDDTEYGGSGVDWEIGVQKGRTRGSIHRDWVEMTAAEAAEAGVVGIFPRSGWWKERPYLGKGAAKTRYSLIVAIRTPETEVDLYTPVAVEVAQTVQV